jgi:transcriptional regulator with XRE-family HTH domain
MAVPNRDEVRDFLTTRRAKVRPEQVELPTGGNRRVPGLRRAEVALLAGVSVEYYARLERGNLTGVSEAVLDAVARALRLHDAERDHLFERFYPDWDGAADAIVAILRAEAGRDPYDKDLQDLIGELSTLSDQFRAKWGAHDVRRHATGEKHFSHPVVGRLDLLFESADLPADPGWKLLIYTADPASPTADGLALLASWAATNEQPTNPAPAPAGHPDS